MIMIYRCAAMERVRRRRLVPTATTRIIVITIAIAIDTAILLTLRRPRIHGVSAVREARAPTGVGRPVHERARR
jgi:hypothetical protein